MGNYHNVKGHSGTNFNRWKQLYRDIFFFFLIFLFMSDAHHGINSTGTQKYQSTQSNVALTSCHQDSGSPPF